MSDLDNTIRRAIAHKAALDEIEILRGENKTLRAEIARLYTEKRPWSDELAGKTIAIQVKEIDRLQELVAKLQAEAGYTESIAQLKIDRLGGFDGPTGAD